MFEKIRMQLTLVNISIIAILFSLLLIGNYIFSQLGMIERAKFFSKKITFDINAGIIDKFEKKDHPLNFPHLNFHPLDIRPPGSSAFFVKLDSKGTINLISDHCPLDKNYLKVLLERIITLKKNNGIISFDGKNFFYFRSPFKSEGGFLITFHDISHEQSILRATMLGTVTAALICLAISFFGSLYMSGKAMVPIEKAWLQQREFLADASHELRTPLTVIQTNLEVVRGNPEATIVSQDKWLNNIQEELSDMTKLVSSLLFLARADSQEHFLEKKRFCLSKSLHRTIEAFQPVSKASNIELNILIEKELSILGDETKIKQTIEILLDNAFRHTPSSGRIDVQAKMKNNSLFITISDTGEGIEPQYLDKIFQRFYQVDQSRSKGGAGLGLSIAKWIIEKHNGTIAVASQPGVGTKFTITLPS